MAVGFFGTIAAGIWVGIHFTESAPASLGSCVSAPCYRGREDVGVVAVIVAPFEFSHVERQVFGADMVERAHDAALQERPEAVNSAGVNQAANVFALAVPHALMREGLMQVAVVGMLVRGDQANLLVHGGLNEVVERLGVRLADHASYDAALPFHGTR